MGWREGRSRHSTGHVVCTPLDMWCVLHYDLHSHELEVQQSQSDTM